MTKKWKPVPWLHLYRGIKGCLRQPAGRLESHDKGPVGMGCQACQLPTPNEHLAKAGRTHSSSTLPTCDRETSRQLDRGRMWQPATTEALAWLRTVTMEINGEKKDSGGERGTKTKGVGAGGVLFRPPQWQCVPPLSLWRGVYCWRNSGGTELHHHDHWELMRNYWHWCEETVLWPFQPKGISQWGRAEHWRIILVLLVDQLWIWFSSLRKYIFTPQNKMIPCVVVPVLPT